MRRPSSGVLTVLGVDDYLNRFYAIRAAPFGLYIGYYRSQRQGDTMHSPLNCLPGAGWPPTSKVRSHHHGVTDARKASGARSRSTAYVIEKGLDRQLVLYWYQSHGRVIASEYRSKIYSRRRIALNRTDAALVRVITPLGDQPEFSETAAEARAENSSRRCFRSSPASCLSRP